MGFKSRLRTTATGRALWLGGETSTPALLTVPAKSLAFSMMASSEPVGTVSASAPFHCQGPFIYDVPLQDFALFHFQCLGQRGRTDQIELALSWLRG